MKQKLTTSSTNGFLQSNIKVYYQEDIDELQKENEQLKKEKQDLIEYLETNKNADEIIDYVVDTGFHRYWNKRYMFNKNTILNKLKGDE